ncbi:MAG: methyl-accepting chemotaxis protein, partial [Arenicella sp.]
MSFIKNFSLKFKLLLLTLPLLVAIMCLSVLQLAELNHNAESMAEVELLARLTKFNSLVVHEIQKERGITAGYLGSNGVNFGRKLKQQYQNSKQAINSRNDFLTDFRDNYNNREIMAILDDIDQSLSQISIVRDKVGAVKITTGKAIAFYTQLNARLLQVAILIIKYSDIADVNRDIMAYANFLQGKERAGIERAVLSKTFARNSFDTGDFEKLITLISQQDTYHNNFKGLATPSNQRFFDETMVSQVVSDVEFYRNIAKGKASEGNFDTDASKWFDAATARINLLKEVEDHLSEALLEIAGKKYDKANRLLMIYLLVTVVIIGMAIILSLLIQANLKRQIASLVDTINAAHSQRDLSVRAEVINNDEIGEVAGKLNEMLSSFAQVVDSIGASSQQLASAVEETATTVWETNQNLITQQSETAQLATAINEMTATAQEVANNTQQAAESAREAQHETREGYQLVTNAVEEVQALSAEVENVSLIFGELNKRSSSITGVLDVIKNVADQTNLLALNAAIEAARAGEQGRGFAVVADEVRSLALRTQESAAEIEVLLTAFQNDTQRADIVVAAS